MPIVGLSPACAIRLTLRRASQGLAIERRDFASHDVLYARTLSTLVALSILNDWTRHRPQRDCFEVGRAAGVPKNNPSKPLTAVSGSTAPNNADWTMKPRKNESRTLEVFSG